ncbi:MAG: smmJ2 [Halothiobacillaceae bacterium]|nr:MAG: smmJ2 [Halothiobacillaceae bacterium]
MFLMRVLCAGVGVCLALPAWTVVASEYQEIPLVISAAAAPKVDPALQAFIQQIWSENPALQGVQAVVDAAQARAEGAGKPLHNPTLALDTQRTQMPSNTTTIGLSQTIDWSDKQGALSGVANQEVQVATAALLVSRQRIAVEALDALVRYFTAQEKEALALRRSQLMQGFIDAVQQRQAAGDMGALEVTLAQVAYSEALLVQAASASERAEAEAALQAVSGLTLAHWPPLPREKARIKVAEREGRADPTIGIRAGREGTETLVGLSVEIPLLVRNSYQAAVRAAAHEAVAEELAYRDAYRRATAHLGGALGRFENTSRAWRAWVATGQEAQREQGRLLEQMWQAGELAATDFLIQAKQNIDTQAAATTLKGEVWRAAIGWLKASGQIEPWLGLSRSTTDMSSGEQP